MLSKMLRNEIGPGFDIEPQSDRIKLTYREPGTATRSAATLQLSWNATSSGEVMEIAKKLRQYMEEQNTTLAKAYRFHHELEFPTNGGGLDWKAITTAFLQDRRNLKYKASTQRGYWLVCDNLLTLMDG